jgi:hypothetical protein
MASYETGGVGLPNCAQRRVLNVVLELRVSGDGYAKAEWPGGRDEGEAKEIFQVPHVVPLIPSYAVTSYDQ